MIDSKTLRLLVATDPVKAVHVMTSLIRTGENMSTTPIYESNITWLDKSEALEDFTVELKFSREKRCFNVFGLTLRIAHRDGGREGEGDHVERVIAIVDIVGNDLAYIQQTGFYSSDYGTEWDDSWEQVYPREVKIIQYFNTL